MAETVTTFDVRPGTIDFGKDYEMQVAAILSLRCVLSTEDMWLASNPEGVGALDDVILNVKKPGGHALTYMLQLKHREKPDPIAIEEYLTSKKNNSFLLKKYYKDIDELNKCIQASDKKDIIKKLGEFSDIYFVLFTNRPTNSCRFLKGVEASHLSDLSLINTSKTIKAAAFVFDTNEISDSHVSKDFKYSTFYLLANQVHATCINAKIVEELTRIADKLNLKQLNLKDISEKYLKFIIDWAKGQLGGHYCLTLRDVVWKLTDLFLSGYEVDLSAKRFEDCTSHSIETWNQIIGAKPITIVDSCESVDEYLIRYLAKQMVQYCNKPGKFWADGFSIEEQNLFYSKHAGFEADMLKIIGKSGKVTLLDLRKCLWKTGKCPLLLEISKEHEYKNIISILKLCNPPPQVIIINNIAKFSGKIKADKNMLMSLQDLNETQRQMVLERPVKVQGRASAKLRDLVDAAMFGQIKTRDIINILTDQFGVGAEPGPLPPYFIQRSTRKIFLGTEVLTKITNEIFLLSNCSKDDQYKTIGLDEINSIDLEAGNVYTVRDNDWNKTLIIKSSKRTVHCLSAYDENRLEWKCSLGTIESIRPYQVPGDAFEDNIKDYFGNAVNIISEVPGMGKSFLLDFIARQAPPDQWVLRIDLNDELAYFRNLQNSRTKFSQHLNYFYDSLLAKNPPPNAKLSQMVFQKLMKEQSVLVLLDGFDEVSVSYKDEVTNLAKCLQKAGYSLWLTTRPHMKDHLEREFDTFAISLKPFTSEDQKQFLIEYFNMETPKADVSPENFARQLLRAASDNLNDREATLTGVALQTRLLADFFTKTWKDFVENGTAIRLNEKFDLGKLYESFIKKKIDAFYGRFGEHSVLTFATIKEHQFLFAVRLVFPLEEIDEVDVIRQLDDYYAKNPGEKAVLQRIGIMMISEKGNISCTHRTFAEYLTAQWLSNNFDNGDLQIRELCMVLIKKRSTLQYSFLFNIFDRFAAQDCPLHMAIINGHVGEAKRIINESSDDVFAIDNFGRTAMHIAPLYGRLTSFISDEFDEDTLVIVKKLPNDADVYSKLDELGYSPLDYALDNKISAIVVEAIRRKVNSSGIRAKINITDKDAYLFRCCKLGYGLLLDLLLPYFISRDLLRNFVQGYTGSKYTDKDAQLRTYLLGAAPDYPEAMTVLEYLQSDKGRFYSGFTGDGYSDMRFAVAFGNRDNVERLLLAGVDLNKQDVDGNTPLHYAVGTGDLETVKLFLSKGALSHIRNITLATPLDVAERKQNFHMLELLMASLINGNRAYIGRKSLLHFVAEYGYCQDTDKLFKTGDIDKFDNNKNTPLHLALSRGKLKIVKLLILKGADVSLLDGLDRNAFHYAVLSQYGNIVSSFATTSTSVNQQDVNGDTPLHLAVSATFGLYDNEAVSFLLANGAKANVRNRKGETPLHVLAKSNGYVAGKNMKLLLGDADVNAQNEKGETVLHVAVNRLSSRSYVCDASGKEMAQQISEASPFHIFRKILIPYLLSLRYDDEDEDVGDDVVRLVLSKDVDVNIKNKNGDSALHLAVKSRSLIDVKAMLSKLPFVDINQQDARGNSYLHLALRTFGLDVVLRLIACGIGLNTQNDEGDTALHLAAYTDYYVTFLLVCFGADTDKQNNDRDTPLHLAFYNGFTVIADLLIAASARVDIQNEKGVTALHCACENGYSAIFDHPNSQNADLNVQNDKGDTPLHIAASLGRLTPDQEFFAPDNFNCEAIIHKLLAKHVDINVQNKDGDTALLKALKAGQVAMAALLLDSGADVNLQNNERKTALIYAISDSFADFATELVLKGADVNAQDSVGNTPLSLACQGGHTDFIELLISHDADVNLKNKEGKTAFHFACESIFNELTIRLTSENRGLNRKDAEGNTLLNLAIIKGFKHAAQLLLDAKIDVNVKNNYGCTSLHYASKYGYDGLVVAILDKRANIDKRDGEDNTSLHLAVMNGHVGTVRTLICRGARLDIVNSPFGEGHTPLHLAVIGNNVDIAKILLDKGANATKLTKTGQNVLHYVKDYDLARELLSKGADVNAIDSDGNGPLHIAAAHHPNLATLFAIHGADVNVQDANGDTPLILATRAGCLRTVAELIFKCADVNLQNNSGDPALFAALEDTRLEIVLVLLAFGADTKLKNLHERTALSTTIKSVLRAGSLSFHNKDRDWKTNGLARYQTILRQWTSVLTFLVEHGEDLDYQDDEGNTPLHYATMLYNTIDFDFFDLPELDDAFGESYDAFQEDIVKMLLGKDVDVDIRNNNGKTALDVSYDTANTDATALLLQHRIDKTSEVSDSD